MAKAQQATPSSLEVQRINAFFETSFNEAVSRSPMYQSYLGIKTDYDKLDDMTDATAVREHEISEANYKTLTTRFDFDKLDAQAKLSYQIAEKQWKKEQAAHRFRRHEYIFDQMSGLQSSLPAFLINIHQVATLDDARAYVARLLETKRAMGQAIEEAESRAEMGVMPPKWVYPLVIEQSKNVIAGAPFDESGKDSTLLADIRGKLAQLEADEATKAALLENAAAALKASVGPAYTRLLAMLEDQVSRASTNDGVWRLPNGAEYYRERLAHYTTTDMTADAIHQLGLSEVARIHAEMRGIMKEVGFAGTLQEFFKSLHTKDELFYTTREEYLEDANATIAAMSARLPEYFNTLPKADLKVKPVEAFREKSGGKAFYQRPAPDGSRPGTYYVNLFNLRDMSKTEMEALAYHEGVPGHHLQLSIATELKNMPKFRKFGSFTAYSEGWGLYSERLGKEMGFYKDPYSDFGRLGMELWRACRLVVDTGIHHKRWSRADAIAYLGQNTPNPRGDVVKAIERYIVYPGQATAYKIGQLKILELRNRAQLRLGDKFSFGGFHDAVLKGGPVPLDILSQNVDRWIASAQR